MFCKNLFNLCHLHRFEQSEDRLGGFADAFLQLDVLQGESQRLQGNDGRDGGGAEDLPVAAADEGGVVQAGAVLGAPADPADLALDVEAPSGEVLAIDDPALLRQLAARAGDDHSLTLLRSERAMTDCRPISLFSLQTARQL